MADDFCPLDELQPASFRGVSFFVETDTGTFGRRVITHEYPMRDDPFNEDMGAKAQKFSVTGYVFSISAKNAFVAAATQTGAGLLVMPAEAPFMARLLEVSVKRTKDKQSYFDLECTFVREGVTTPLFAVGVAELQVLNSVSSFVTTTQAYLDTAMSLTNVLPYVGQTAINILQDAAASTYAAVGAVVADQTALTPVAVAALELSDNAPALLSSSGVAASVNTLMNAVYTAVAPADALTVFTAMSSFSSNETMPPSTQVLANVPSPVTPTTPPPLSPSDAANAANIAALNNTVRNIALTYYAAAASATTYTNRSDAIQTRADLVESFAQQVEDAGDPDSSVALTVSRNTAVQSITRQMTTLAPIVTIEAPSTMPSLYWASRLYNDATRAQELADRNQVSDPMVMPRVFEALAS